MKQLAFKIIMVTALVAVAANSFMVLTSITGRPTVHAAAESDGCKKSPPPPFEDFCYLFPSRAILTH
jgi:hypothetical protein